MDALLMCGGRGTRLGAGEKPLVSIAGRPMVDRVFDALVASRVDRIVAVTSPDVPKTMDHLGCSTIETPGDGYVADLQVALDTDGIRRPVLTVAADLPLLDGAVVDGVLDAAETESLAPAVPAGRVRGLGFSVDSTIRHRGQRLRPAGINVVGDADDTVWITRDRRLAANVNRPGDVARATWLLRGHTNCNSHNCYRSGSPPLSRTMQTDIQTDPSLEPDGSGGSGGPGSGELPGRVPHGGADDHHLLDFSANVNPRIPDGVTQVYAASLTAARSYPSDEYPDFRGAAARYCDCEPSQIVPTPGGLAAIRLAMRTLVSPGDSVLVPTPSFGEFAREVRLRNAEPEFVPVADLPDADPAEYAMVVACTPNNPTGEAYDPARLRSFADRCRDADTPLLVDEAFLGFTDLPSMAGTDGVVCARSLTKLFGLPGLRAGFAVATGDLLDGLRAARRTWSLGTPAAAVGAYCMAQGEFVAETRDRVRSERARMADRLSARFDVYSSDAPFLLFEATDPDAVDDVLRTVHDHGIAVRDARTFRGLDRHVRVAVRLPDENDELLAALDV